MAIDPYEDISPEERGFEPVFEGNTLYSGGETQDATGQEFEQLFKIRESGGTFYPQLIKEDAEGRIVGQETLGRSTEDREKAKERVEGRLRQRVAPGRAGFAVGDFLINSNQNVTQAQAAHRSRSDRAVRQDNRKRAAITTDTQTYVQNPGQYDYPGVDTPTEDPKALPKDYKRGGEPQTTEVDEESEVAAGKQQSESLPTPSMFAPEPFASEFSERDVSLSPDEAFNATGAVGMTALGGFDSATFRDKTENAPRAELEDPPESALQQQAEQSRSGNERERGSVPMQPYQSRNDGPPSQIGPYKLIKDSQSDAGREIAFSSDELDRSVVFQQYDSQEETEATVDVWWQDNAETVYEGSPDDAFEVFVGELEDRAEQNKKRTGSSGGIQSREAERAESLMNLFGV